VIYESKKKIGDIFEMGFKQRTFWQWIKREPQEPQKWIVYYITDGLCYIQQIENENP